MTAFRCSVVGLRCCWGCRCGGHSGDGRIWVVLIDCSDLACCDGLFVCLLVVSGLFIRYMPVLPVGPAVAFHCGNG